jgi:hypothetical protein
MAPIASPGAGLTVAIPLAFLWWLNAAAVYVPGTGYVRLPILFVMATVCFLWRVSRRSVQPREIHDSGITIGLGCLFTAATLSTILNWHTEDVVATYIFVFLSGAAVFVALMGMTCTPAGLDVALVGLIAGALFPLIGGLLAFNGEWGTPDATTTILAWQNLARMNTYTDATFGNRGNTAGFLLILTPMLITVLLDRRKRLALRALCAATLVPIALNLMVLQIRAAYITLFVACAVVWAFKLGRRRIPLMVGLLVLGWVLLFKFQSDAGALMAERIIPAITVDTEGDESVQNRVEAIKEGIDIAQRNWLLGIGPGGALTIHTQTSAHQFFVQQGMETGILGLIGSILFSVGLGMSLFRTLARGRGDEVNDTRFLLLIGPTTYLTYAIISNAALNNGSVNTWTVLIASMVALAPQFETRTAARLAAVIQRSVPVPQALLGTYDRVPGPLVHERPIAHGRWRHDE